jgi:GTP-binding protein
VGQSQSVVRQEAKGRGLTPELSEEEIEAGRRLFAAEWHFSAAARSWAALPAGLHPEVAFAGRSNVGKSSLVNALTGRRALARTSRVPGRTQELIFFGSGKELTLVDMPGYGYAAAPKAQVTGWTNLMQAYLVGRPNLARVYVLIDARRGPKPTDAPVLDALDRAAVSYQVVLTKADEVRTGELDAVIEAAVEGISRRPAAFPSIIATSARTGLGIAELRAAIARTHAQSRDGRAGT